MIRGMAHAERPEKPHDILAAEEFAMPTVDPALRHGPVSLPADPSGIPEAHDVLAAEEFAMPAPRSRPGLPSSGFASREDRATLAALAGVIAVLLLIARVLRRR
jgi:hypothetical protein